MKIIYLPYEIYTREVPGHLYLAEKLLNMGAADRIYIGSMLVLGQLARRGFLPPGVWFLKSAQKYILKFLKRLKKRGFKIILQDAEAVSTFDQSEDIDLFMKAKSCRDLCDAIFVSTNAEYRGLELDGESDKLSLTGGLRFYTFFDDRFKKSIQKIENQKKLLFISSATSLRMHKAYNASEMYDVLLAEGIQEKHASMLMSWAEQSHYDLLEVLGVLARFIRNYGDNLKIVIRPHPSEDFKVYQGLFSGFRNVKVDGDMNLYTQLIQSDAVIVSTGSTTAVEAALLNCRPIMCLFSKGTTLSKFLERHITGKVCKICNSPDELFEDVKNVLDGHSVNDEANVDNAVNYLNLSSENLKKASNIFGMLTVKCRKIKLYSAKEKLIIILYKVAVALFKTLAKYSSFSRLSYALQKSKPKDQMFIQNYAAGLSVEIKNIDDSLFIVRKVS